MLLLYQTKRLQKPKERFIYIPLCFYFIGMHACEYPLDCLFTFHYASTLSTRTLVSPQTRSIYIPLCFYFIRMAFIDSIALSIIYIPLCFYFICLRWNRIYISLLIYIPLCFYFIQSVPGRLHSLRSFTFHYASTLSKVTQHTSWYS